MLELLGRLYAIKFSCSDIHYKVKGESFYGQHIFADMLRDDLDSFIDSINEVCFLGSNEETPLSIDVIRESEKYICPNQQTSYDWFCRLADLIFETLRHIESLMSTASVGEANLLGNIAENLQKKYGLIGREISQ